MSKNRVFKLMKNAIGVGSLALLLGASGVNAGIKLDGLPGVNYAPEKNVSESEVHPVELKKDFSYEKSPYLFERASEVSDRFPSASLESEVENVGKFNEQAIVTSKDLTSKISPNFVSIFVTNHKDPKSPEFLTSGSGVLLGKDGRILTASHMLDRLTEKGNSAYGLTLGKDGKKYFSPIKLRAMSKSHDIALGDMENGLFSPDVSEVKISERVLNYGEPLYVFTRAFPKSESNYMFAGIKFHIIGNPLEGFLLWANPEVARDKLIATRGGYSQLHKAEVKLRNFSQVLSGKASELKEEPEVGPIRRLTDAYILDGRKIYDLSPLQANLKPGNSGSPIFDKEGNLTGVLSTGDLEGTGFVTSQRALSYLIKGDVPNGCK